MSGWNTRFLTAYISLVGLPLLALVAFLDLGRKLTARASVEGLWDLHADLKQPNGSGCADLLIATARPAIAIAQSGRNLVVDFEELSKTNVSGVVEGAVLTVGSPLRVNFFADGNSCKDGSFAFTATVSPTAKDPTISGVLFLNGCSSCPPVPFRATRRMAFDRTGGH